MNATIVPREQVARALSISTSVLMRYEALGLVQAVRQGGLEGYGPTEIRRVWTIVTCHRDLGINLAGVEAVLRLRDHMADLHHRLEDLASQLREALDSNDRDAGPPDA